MKTIAQIAASLEGYDPQSLPAEGVLDFLSRLVSPVAESRALPLFEALGKVLAGDVISPLDVPPHDNSAMDGYAFDGRQLRPDAPLQLQVVGTVLAGKAWAGQAGAGECVKIMTGAIMPAGIPGDNRRLRGEDVTLGHPALRRGQRVTPARLGLAASLGLPTLPCFRPLRVAYFSTGDEILSLGEPPREGAVYDSNRFTAFGLLKRLGCEVIDMGVVKDDPVLLEAAFRSAAAQADAIITSGGVSVGEADYTKAMMKKLGDVAFWRIAMRPGRPMAVGRIADAGGAGAMLFGLPGNPVAVMVTFLAFVRPALLQMMGCSDNSPPLLKAHSQEPLRKKAGRTEYQRGWVSHAADGSLQVRTTGNQGSGVLSSMAEANGLIVLHHGQGHVAAGDLVDVMMFDGVI
jgi:molybdopterin molybdotransferase